MTSACQLPVAVDIQPGEDIVAFLQRVADANYLDFRDLTSHRRTARVWENPEHPFLAQLSSITRGRRGTPAGCHAGGYLSGDGARTGPDRAPVCRPTRYMPPRLL